MKVQDKKRARIQQSKPDALSSSAAKGERLRRVRHLANLSREEFCKDGEVNITTLISWEVGRFSGLSAKGASRVIARIAKEGVFCTPEWLLYEIGVGPEVRTDYKKMHQKNKADSSKNFLSSEKETIVKELMIFRKLNKNSVDFIVEDDAMLPQFQVGDYVAGTKRYGDQIQDMTGYDCIIHIADGLIVLRSLQTGPRKGSYNLVSTNLRTNVKNSIIHDVEVVSAAPVIWHRRKEPLK